MSVIIFLAVLFVLVLVHELGHFATAKWFGMRVDEFGIGFPPKLFGFKRGETEYTFNLFPIGGFVKIYGEDYGTEDEGKASPQEPAPGSFTSKSRWAQSIVLLAGITMNILFAWFIVAIAFGIGVDREVSPDVASENARLTITNVLPGSPAAEAQIAPGSVIKSAQAGDETLTELNPKAFIEFIGTHSSEPITLVYTNKGEPGLVQLTPKAGLIPSDPEHVAIGVSLTQIERVQRSFIESITDSFVYVVTGLRDIAVGIGGLFADSVKLEADFSQVAGPVGIVGLVGEASAYGVTSLLMFTAFISLNLAVINVLPFPALDGGRLLFVCIEAIKGSAINPKYVGLLNSVGFIILLILMVAVTWNDIARLI